MKNLESFGSIRHYKRLIDRVKDDRILWRKVANILNNVRYLLHISIDNESQFRSGIGDVAINYQEIRLRNGEEYAIQALRDTKLPREVKIYMIMGMMSEFGFTFESA